MLYMLYFEQEPKKEKMRDWGREKSERVRGGGKRERKREGGREGEKNSFISC